MKASCTITFENVRVDAQCNDGRLNKQIQPTLVHAMSSLLEDVGEFARSVSESRIIRNRVMGKDHWYNLVD